MTWRRPAEAGDARHTGVEGMVMRIGDVVRQTGASPKAIRLYEARGLIRAPRREGRYRRFSAEDVERIQLLREAQQLGFTLAEIAELLPPDASCARIPWAHVRRLAAAKAARLEQTIATLAARRDALARFAAQGPVPEPHCAP